MVVHIVHVFMSDHERPPLKPDTMAELRKYKAEHGLTYDEAVRKLLKEAGWINGLNNAR